MNKILIAAALALLAAPALADKRPYTIHDQVMLERVSDPRLSPDGSRVAYQLRETKYEANKGQSSLWLLDLNGPPAPRRLTAPGSSANTPRWSADGKSLYFMSTRSGSAQLWKLDLSGGEAQQVSDLPLDVGSFVLAPDGRSVALSMEVFPDCADLACTKDRLDQRAGRKASGTLYDKLFVRHWDSWKNGTRAQLFLYELGDVGTLAGAARWLSKGIDGDVPSKPFGDDSEFAFAPDGKTVYFSARVAGTTEPWSTNFDLWQVPADGSAPPRNLSADNPAWDTGPLVSPDGQWLAYRAMRRPAFEADRFAIKLRHLASGATREVAAAWDRSPATLAWSDDGKTLYATAYDLGQKPLFAIDVASGAVRKLVGEGTVSGASVRGGTAVIALESLAAPNNLYRLDLAGGAPVALTRHNAERMGQVQLAAYEQFTFKGWKGETVYGHVMKPWNYEAGKKYPVAFIIHGGPQSSMGNNFHYRWNPQTYAGRGYAVVFIDFHGSAGYGQAFTDSISGDWGGKPLEDLQKGWAHALKTYAFLDGTRACALGASYGGYMINWIAGRWNEAFQCLVNHDGVFDSRSMYYTTEELWFDEWEHGGPQFVNPKAYEKHNPVNQVAQWRVPMLVVHGGMDYRVPPDQGIGAFTAMQRQGIPSQFLYFPDENHWVLKPQNSVQWHEAVEAWMEKWLKS